MLQLLLLQVPQPFKSQILSQKAIMRKILLLKRLGKILLSRRLGRILLSKRPGKILLSKRLGKMLLLKKTIIWKIAIMSGTPMQMTNRKEEIKGRVGQMTLFHMVISSSKKEIQSQLG